MPPELMSSAADTSATVSAPAAVSEPSIPASEITDFSSADDYDSLIAEDDFGDSSEGSVGTSLPTESSAEGTPPPVAPTTTTQPNVAPPTSKTDQGVAVPPTEVPPVVPTAQPVPPTTPQQPEAPPATPPQPATAEPSKEKMEELVAQQVSRLEESYAIPQELVLDLHAEPEKVLPKLAARIHAQVVNDLVRVFEARLPQALEQINARTQKEQEARTMFYTRWPELKQYEAQVLKAGAMFREINPTATAADTVEKVGQLVYASLGLQLPQAPGSVTPPAAQPAPQAPAFTPAMPGAAGVPVVPTTAQNPFTQLANEFLMGDNE